MSTLLSFKWPCALLTDATVHRGRIRAVRVAQSRVKLWLVTRALVGDGANAATIRVLGANALGGGRVCACTLGTCGGESVPCGAKSSAYCRWGCCVTPFGRVGFPVGGLTVGGLLVPARITASTGSEGRSALRKQRTAHHCTIGQGNSLKLT